MDRRLKVLTLVGTRPEIIKLSRIIAELDRTCDHVLVHSGQNFDYELNEIFFRDLGLRKPDWFLGAAGNTPAETIAAVLTSFDELLGRVAPEAVLIYGDTNTGLGAIAAKRRKIPIFHMEAGNRSFDQRVPEEMNRKIIDHISDINLPLTEHARRYLLAEGLPPDRVIKSGSTMYEVLSHYRPGIDASDILGRLGLTPARYFLVSVHREENVDDPDRLAAVLSCLEALASRFEIPVIISTPPRTRLRLEAAGLASSEAIRFLKPFGFFDYVRLQRESFCVVSDSGTITEEAAILGFPALTLREAHERPEGMDGGVLVMSSLDPDRLLQAVLMITSQHRADRPGVLVPDYVEPDVSIKVARIILSYVDYVNRVVWRKPPMDRQTDWSKDR